MRWKFLALDQQDKDTPFPDRLEGTVEDALAYAQRFTAPDRYVLAATDGPTSAFGLPEGWQLFDVTQFDRMAWTISGGRFSSARRAISYELHRKKSKPTVFRVIRRDGSVAQIAIYPGDGHGQHSA